MLMSAIASPRLGIGPLIRVNTSVSSVLFSSRKRSCWSAGWCGLQMALKPWPFHVPRRPARAPSGSGAAASALIASGASASGVASPANAKSESVCVPAVMMTPSRISSRLDRCSSDYHDYAFGPLCAEGDVCVCRHLFNESEACCRILDTPPASAQAGTPRQSQESGTKRGRLRRERRWIRHWLKPGYWRRKSPANWSLRTWVRTWSKRRAPRGVQRSRGVSSASAAL